MPDHDVNPQETTPSDASHDPQGFDEIFSDTDFARADHPSSQQEPLEDSKRRMASQTRPIEDLTLWDFLQRWRTSRRDYTAALRVILFDDSRYTGAMVYELDSAVDDSLSDDGTETASHRMRVMGALRSLDRAAARVWLYVAALVVALLGNSILVGTEDGVLARRSEAVQLANGAPWLIAAFLLAVLAELVFFRPALREWWQSLPSGANREANETSITRRHVFFRLIPVVMIVLGIGIIWRSTTAPTDRVLSIVTPGLQLMVLGGLFWGALDWLQPLPAASAASVPGRYDPRPWYMRIHPSRPIFGLIAMVLSTAVWFGTANNNIPTPILYLWLASALFWAMTFAPEGIEPLARIRKWVADVRGFAWRDHGWVIGLLALIMLVGFVFRFERLAEHPREMTDDHVELILDAGLVREGLRAIFFANNGGREPVQMYTIAAASYLPGLGIDHYTIKFVAAVESLLTIPIFFWLGFALMGGDNRRLRLLMGLLVAAFLATSYWHVAISRLALRIVLTPPLAALMLIFLARALRTNNRMDYILTGLILGYGLYMYQAVRMLPVVIVLAVAIVFYFYARTWRERGRIFLNMVVLVYISFMVFLPMFHYSLEQPDQFWRRTTGRLLGDDIIEEQLPDGTVQMREASVAERVEAFQGNIPILMSNIRNALLMFNWKGDVATINGVPNAPALDVYSGALFIVGLAAWGSLMIRKRDPVHWLLIPALFIMLLPSALSIAFPVENPSHTRTSGAIPFVYVILAFPLALLMDNVMGQSRSRLMTWGLVVVCGLVVMASYTANRYTYFVRYPPIYADSFDPYTEPGEFLRGFALSTGSYGNAFMIGYPHWWSHRAIGLAAGLETRWPNGVVTRTDIPLMLENSSQQTGIFRMDPEKDLLFFYSPDDVDSSAYLQELFPQGREARYQTYARNNDFMWYMVPALGADGFAEWLATYRADLPATGE